MDLYSRDENEIDWQWSCSMNTENESVTLDFEGLEIVSITVGSQNGCIVTRNGSRSIKFVYTGETFDYMANGSLVILVEGKSKKVNWDFFYS